MTTVYRDLGFPGPSLSTRVFRKATKFDDPGECHVGEKHKGISSMRRQRGYLYGSLGVAVALLSMVAALEAQVAMAPLGVDRSTVNRALKGDRWPLIPGAIGANPIELPRVREPKLPDGCDDANAPRSPFSAEVAGRCLAAAPTDRPLVIVG
jgi:hypothetical protein